ncbi:hypothetical protein E1B28_002694 [Marasmius oreades]|uniref:ABC1 atypical kinase-like domain-containing protein n=1 Tax=Marasmius oreades TaxID=181124 RepID=A0A9P7UL30_9AGAR|nr:uncharacterized protein E1B28_002694 [Marasmius oreades]KAG7086762.1 hypothetical protein E1B28_002694 [Marasmius oreades]
MPPGPAYNWLCVLSSVADIASHAVRYRATQLSTRRLDVAGTTISTETVPRFPPIESGPVPAPPPKLDIHPALDGQDSHYSDVQDYTPTAVEQSSSLPLEPSFPFSQEPTVVHTRNLQSSKVPSSRIGRLFHYGGLAASLSYGMASEFIQPSASRKESGGSLIMTEANIKRLVAKLSQMRGAALKLGQFLSIQDTHLLPPELDKIFRRVQDSAHYMPDWQMEKVLVESLGPDYSRHFVSFDRIPFAAASIGQVHSAVLTAETSPTGKPAPVAVKIQFPNIATSISSDIGYIKLLLTAGKLLPKGLFLDRTIQVMKQELAEECDYKREGSFMRAFGSSEYLGGDKRFKVPWVWDGSTERVLVMERVDGISVGEVEVSDLSQAQRDEIASNIILLCLRELFEFRMMQTDPNYTNFLYNQRTRQIELVDFGATREYSKPFMDRWLRLLQAAAEDPEDREACVKESLSLGYLTGQENEEMLNAHVKSLTLLATPFKQSTRQPYSFGPGTDWESITKEIRNQIPVMLQYRLTPPPRETYSLNRKLSGAFLLASRLRAVVDTKAIWDSVVEKYRFD